MTLLLLLACSKTPPLSEADPPAECVDPRDGLLPEGAWRGTAGYRMVVNPGGSARFDFPCAWGALTEARADAGAVDWIIPIHIDDTGNTPRDDEVRLVGQVCGDTLAGTISRREDDGRLEGDELTLTLGAEGDSLEHCD